MSPTLPTHDDIDLSTMLCFDLYAASRVMTSVYRQALDPVGLTYPQYLVMVVLWTHGDMSVREVIDRLHLDYGTVSPLLKRLESRGLVERRRRAEDERSVVVSLTEAGRALREKARHVPATIGAAFGLPEEGMAALRTLLSTVTASATSHAERSGAAPATTAG